MGLVDKLTEVDKTIWRGYEKVTQYCNKEYGWNKWDLARGAHLASQGCALIGAATFFALGWETESYLSMGVGIFFAGSRIPNARYELEKIGEKESKEAKQLEKRIVHLPEYKFYRPFGYVAALGSFALTYILRDTLTAPVEDMNYELMQYMKSAWTVIISATVGGVSLAATSESYFKDQIMTPPKKKKSVLKAITGKVSGKLQVETPVTELTKYLTIDEAMD